ncbi:Type IV fimbrial biogenesis protein PilY1 [Polaromonas sp. CG9_12]|nr:Type IV fimbrial biogenesis protein PilY1 [Polaromonas sp. CG9_12]
MSSKKSNPNKTVRCKRFELSSIALVSKLLAAGFIVQAGTALATPFPLAQQPAGTGGREPAPNVIITVDDSGSMSEVVGGGNNKTKISELKNSLISQFGDSTANPPTKGKLEDDRIRLAWQAMHNNGNAPGAGSLTAGGTNTIRSFSGTHRVNFNTFINSLSANGGTPSHKMMQQVYNYMKLPQGTNSPWADVPGSTQTTPYMACRRTYHIFMTDGGWNGEDNQTVGNADGVASMLGDGITSYAPAGSDQLNVYKDIWGGTIGVESTLADFAFASWANDLQPDLPNNIQPLIRKSGSELVGNINLQEFWNPKNNPAAWQHIVTNTIGFGAGAVSWKTGNALIPPFFDTVNNNTYGGDYSRLVNGLVSWPDPSALGLDGRPVELWHMALNGRGKFYPAKSADALSAAFADILDNVINDTSKPLVSVSANTSRIRTNTLFYSAGYDGKEWSGYLKAYKVTNSGIATNPEWNAADLLDAVTPINRVVLSHNGTSGVPFRWNSLPTTAPATQQTLLNSTDNRGSDRVDYLRGIRTAEGTDVASLRTRTSILGDIVNSNILYLGAPSSSIKAPGYSAFITANAARTPMLYIGGNDGMLHGFVASTGQERIAYVPAGSYANLVNYTKQSYTHKYFVDGSAFSGDVRVVPSTTSVWKSYLAGFMAAGGKGYFVLDVTDPTAANFSESNASSLVVLDNTVPSDNDVGNIFSQPSKDPADDARAVQFAMMNNDRPALILGNGVNSTNERPVLLIQYLDGAKEIFKLVASATAGQSNGLNNPQVIDVNNDGKADLVYAGDLLGNMWKFDLSASTQADWKVSFNNNPLFTAADSGGSPQPIMAAPVWLPHPKGGIMLGFGTGRNLTSSDRTDTSQQTLYAVWDNSLVTVAANGGLTITDDATQRIVNGRTSLVSQSMGTTVQASYAGRSFFTFAANKVNYETTGINPNRRGWYMNFTEPGERGSSNSYWFGGDYVVIPSAKPAAGTDSNTETCSLTSKPEVGYLTVVNLISGAPPNIPVFDTDGGGFTGSEVISSKVSNQSDSIFFRKGANTGDLQDGKNNPGLFTRLLSNPGLTTGWRER